MSKTTFYVYLVNEKTKIIKQEILLDYIVLLYPTKSRPFKYSNKKMLVPAIERFEM